MSHYPTDPISFDIGNLAWLEGRWIGDYKGERIEEHCSAASCGMMMGMFRWERDGKIWMTEHFTIEANEDGLVLRIKHFHSGLIAWKEKEESVTFDLVELTGQSCAWLRRGGKGTMWLLYERKGDVFEAWFEKEAEPSPLDGRFRYTLNL